MMGKKVYALSQNPPRVPSVVAPPIRGSMSDGLRRGGPRRPGGGSQRCGLRLSQHAISVIAGVFGVPLDASFRTRERPKATRYTGRASGHPFRTRRTCLSSEGDTEGSGLVARATGSPSRWTHAVTRRMNRRIQTAPRNSAMNQKKAGVVVARRPLVLAGTQYWYCKVTPMVRGWFSATRRVVGKSAEIATGRSVSPCLSNRLVA